MPETHLSRQSFLGPLLSPAMEHARIAVIGLSGGGSHIVQQLAHIGFQNYALFDPDLIEDTNLTRVVGATVEDVRLAVPKIDIATRVIRSVQPRARILGFQSKWQGAADQLKCCDLIFGCVDSFLCRRDIEVLARRYRIPYIDIGMDVRQDVAGGHRMYGQAAVSLPGGPCLLCQRVLTPELLAKEATAYGAAGVRPQVVWANGALASTAIGIATDLVTGWSGDEAVTPFTSFDGNTGLLSKDARLAFVPNRCPHHLLEDLGDPRTKTL